MSMFLLGVFILTTIIYCGWALYFLTGLFRKNDARTAGQPFVSVVVAARNEAQHIRACLESLAGQSYPGDRYEVILADDQSEDETPRIAEEMAEKYGNIQYFTIKEVQSGYSPKKNALHQAIMKSRGEIILTTDADCIVPSSWIAGMVSHFTPETGMVAGFSHIDFCGSHRTFVTAIQALDFLVLLAAAAGGIRMGRPQAATGQNLSYRRKAYDEAGGFSAIRHRVSGDDVLLLQLIRKKTRWLIRFAEPGETTAITQAATTWTAFIRQRMRWASNSEIQRILDPGFFLYLLSVFTLSLGMIALGALSLYDSSFYEIWGACAASKAAADLAVFYRGLMFSRAPAQLLRYFPAWFIIQPFLLIVSGIGGLFVKISWKGRTFNNQQEAG